MQLTCKKQIVYVRYQIIPFLEQNEQVQYFPIDLEWRGHATDLTSGDLSGKPEINKMLVLGGLQVLKVFSYYI